MCDRCNALMAENDRLKAMLAIRTRADLVGRIRTAFAVTDQQARIILRLYQDRGAMVRHSDMHRAMPVRYYSTKHGHKRSPDYLRVQIGRIRQNIGPQHIVTTPHKGYRLSPAGVDLVASALSGEDFRRIA